MNNDNIFELICGIRFQNAFKIFDNFGSIVDEILYSESGRKIFGEDYYNSINDGGYQRILCNDKNNNSLKITQNNLILSHTVKNFDKDFDFIKNVITKHLVPKIINQNILVVNRIGLVFMSSFNDNNILKFKNCFLNENECKNITDFRFSTKEPTAAGSVLTDKNDYINKIITVGKIDFNHNGISFDYQKHFIPPRAEIGNVIDSFFSDAQKAFQIDILGKTI